MTVNFRGQNGFNASFYNQTMGANPSALKDGSQASERLGDSQVSQQDYQALKASFVEKAVQAGASPAEAEAEFNHFLADALDGQIDEKTFGAATASTETQIQTLNRHESEPLALRFGPVGQNTPAPSLINPDTNQPVQTSSLQPPVDSNPNLDEAAEIRRTHTEISGLNGQIARRNALEQDLSSQQDLLSRIQRDPENHQYERFRADGSRYFISKAQALAEVEGQITRIRSELQPLRDAGLEAQVLEKYKRALREDGPANTRLKDILAEISQIRSDPEFARLQQALETALGNNQSSFVLDGRTYKVDDLRQEPRFARINQLMSEIESLTGQIHSWGTYVPSSQQEQFNKAGAAIESKGVWDAFKSKAGMDKWLTPVPSSEGSQARRDAAHSTMGYLGTLLGATDVGRDLLRVLGRPELKGISDKLNTMLADLLKKIGPKAFAKLQTLLGEKVTKFLQNAGIGAVFSAYGAAYYGSIASGLNYPNVQLGDPKIGYELRPSTNTRWACGAAAAIDALCVAAAGSGAGAALSLPLGVVDVIAETAAEFMLMQDQEKLEVVDKLLRAETGEQAREALARINASYGGLDKIQEVMGQMGIHQNDGSLAYVHDDQSDVVDREVAGALANKLLEMGIQGKLSIREAQTALKGLIKGTSDRYTSGDDVAQSMVNQIFLKYGKNQQEFERALLMLGSDVRLQLFKSLDSGITFGETGALSWLLEENSSDLSEARVMEYLAGVEPDPATRGKMIAELFDGFTRGRFEDLAFELIQKSYNEGVRSGNFENFNKMLQNIKLDGDKASRMLEIESELDADRVGQVLTWMIKAGTPQADVEAFISKFSGRWFSDDTATSAFMAELRRAKIRPEELQGKISQAHIKQLLDNLQAGWTTNSEYRDLTDLARAANPATRSMILKDLMDWNTVAVAEKAIADIVSQSSDPDLRAMFNGSPALSAADLASEMENTEAFTKVMNRLGKGGFNQEFASYISNASASTVAAGWKAMSWSDARQLNNEARLAMFKKFVDAGNLDYAQHMLMGSAQNGLRGVEGSTREQMLSYLASHIGSFNRDTAPKAAVWILAHGSQSQIDTAMRKIKDDFYFGRGGDVIKQVLDQAKAQGIDIKGKLSLSTLSSMVGSLNSTWTKIFGDYATNVKYVGMLAEAVDVAGKANIINNLMDGWTPGEAETLIHDIFKKTTDDREFTQLVDQVGPAKISNELEERGELGRVMAFVVERYDSRYSVGRRDQDVVLTEMMNQWSDSSIKSDDVIWQMLKQLERDGKLDYLRQYLNNSTLDEMIDWTDDPFRDGNRPAWTGGSVDAESQWSINMLNAHKH